MQNNYSKIILVFQYFQDSLDDIYVDMVIVHMLDNLNCSEHNSIYYRTQIIGWIVNFTILMPIIAYDH